MIPKMLGGHAMLGLGAAGVAVKDVIVDVLALILNNTLANVYIRARFYWRVLYHLMAGAAFWGASSWVGRILHPAVIQVVVGGAVGLAVYCAVLALLGELRGEELRAMGSAIDPQRARLYILGELRVKTQAQEGLAGR
jgi:thiamine transporter ThiT